VAKTRRDQVFPYVEIGFMLRPKSGAKRRQKISTIKKIRRDQVFPDVEIGSMLRPKVARSEGKKFQRYAKPAHKASMLRCADAATHKPFDRAQKSLFT
jgi:hypothetical protein